MGFCKYVPPIFTRNSCQSELWYLWSSKSRHKCTVCFDRKVSNLVLQQSDYCHHLKHVVVAQCRHHRYIFEAAERRGPGEKEKSRRVIARLQELGPRFTLKLLSLQKGTFDSKGGEYEWVHNHKSMDTSRRRFFL